MLAGGWTPSDVVNLVAVFVAGAPGVIAALYARSNNKAVRNGSGVSLAQRVEEVAAAVSTPPGSPTLGQVAADVSSATGADQHQ